MAVVQPRGRSSALGVVVAVAFLGASLNFVLGGAGAPQNRKLRDATARAAEAPAAPEAAASPLPFLENLAKKDAKERLMELLEDSSLEEEVLKPEGKPMRGRVDEAIVRLERLNENEEPVYSVDLDGMWTVKYTGSYAPGLLSSPTRELALFLYGGGFSLGNALSSFAQGFWGQSVGVQLGPKTVQITGGRDVEASAEVELLGRRERLTYKAELMPLSAQRMSEEVVSVKLPDPVGNRDLPVELRRSILVTYLDEEVMIVRDESGVPDVLVKKLSAAPAMEAEEIPEVSTNSTNSKSSLMSPFWARERSNVSNVSTAASDEDRALLDAAGSEAS